MTFLRRRQVMIDQEVQGVLIGRVIVYWLVCQASVFFGYAAWQILTLPSDESVVGVLPQIAELLPALLGSLLLIPLVIADLLRLSNRFVGPIWNLRNAMKRLELGDPVPPLELRRRDFWPDLLRRFNRLCVAGRASSSHGSPTMPAAYLSFTDPADWDGVRGLPVVGETFAEPPYSD